MTIRDTRIPGVRLLTPFAASDRRGTFVKIFQHDDFATHGLNTQFRERFYTTSRRRTLRGLHFQVPPHDGTKLVHCLQGELLDAVLDLRVGSPTYGVHELFLLRSDEPTTIVIPPGLAHGFYALTDDVLMFYDHSCTYDALHDRGVRWDSAGIPWPDSDPILSERDCRFPRLEEFQSPFSYLLPSTRP